MVVASNVPVLYPPHELVVRIVGVIFVGGGPNKKRPDVDNSTPGVNWTGAFVRRKSFSAPEGTLFVTILSFAKVLSD